MKDTFTLALRQRGVITLPKLLRDTYALNSGDKLTLVDIGGVFVMSQPGSEIDKLADQVAEKFLDRGETLENMLTTLREERESFVSP